MAKAKKPVTVGARIEQARTSYRMSQQQLGAMLDVTRAAISLYEKDRNLPRAKVIDRLAEVFGAAPEWFTHGRGEPPRPTDAPISIPEIDASLITPEVANVFALKTDRAWSLPSSVFGCQVAPDHIVAFVAPNDAGSVGAGDRVVVDLNCKKADRPGVYLAYTAGAARLCYRDGRASRAAILGRVVGHFRAI